MLAPPLRALSAALLLLLLAACSSKSGESPDSAFVIVRNIAPKPLLIEIRDPSELAALETFFPNYRASPSSNSVSSCLLQYQVYFNFRGNRTIQLTLGCNATTWSAGQGELPTRGDFKAFIAARLPASTTAPSPATTPAPLSSR